jgi:hypothetical protein
MGLIVRRALLERENARASVSSVAAPIAAFLNGGFIEPSLEHTRQVQVAFARRQESVTCFSKAIPSFA